MLSCTKYIC